MPVSYQTPAPGVQRPGRDKVVSVSLPLGLETIEENAFFGSPLEAVDIPSGVTTIGANAFYGTSLRSAWTPATATSIGTGAFAGCTSLRAVQLTGSLTSLPAHIFKDCAALEAVDIPDAVTDIGALAFGGCSSLKEIALPDGYLPYLPNELTVEQSGARWVVAGGARAGRVAYLRGTKTVDESKLGANPSALKLTSKANGGSFKGTFKVYADVNGRLKATTVNVTGVVIDGTGYGTATIKNGGSAPVAIE